MPAKSKPIEAPETGTPATEEVTPETKPRIVLAKPLPPPSEQLQKPDPMRIRRIVF